MVQKYLNDKLFAKKLMIRATVVFEDYLNGVCNVYHL